MFYGSGAIVIRRQNKLIELFDQNKAVNAESAVSLDDLGVRENFIFYRMAQRKILVQCENGKYYIDHHELARFKERRLKGILVYLFILLVGFILYSFNILN